MSHTISAPRPSLPLPRTAKQKREALARKNPPVRGAVVGQMFARHFREHCLPLLEREIQVQGRRLALGTTVFDAAFGCVMLAARNLGASHLPTALFDELEQWMLVRLSIVAQSCDETVREARRTADAVWEQLAYLREIA